MEKRYLYTVSERCLKETTLLQVVVSLGSHFTGTFAQQEERKKVFLTPRKKP